MIYSKKQAKRLKISPVIDLREIYSKEYLESKKTLKIKILEFLEKPFIIWCILLFITIVYIFWSWKYKLVEARKDFTLQEKIRIERLKSCAKYAQVEKIYNQDAIVRCSTFATIVFAFESDFWKSWLCQNRKNCYWMKGNWIEYPKWFITFSTFEKGNEYFAKKYFQFHYKKKVPDFVRSWSMTDRDAYISFFNVNYKKIYNENLKLKKYL